MRKPLIFAMAGRKTITWATCISFSKICSMRKINLSQRDALSHKKSYLAIAIYISAVVAANLAAAWFGPKITPLIAFTLIGLDLALRNRLALSLLRSEMLLMIAASAAISYLINPASGQVALAGLMAFSASTLADWWLFSSLSGTWFRKCLGGLALGSAIDSFLFPTLAFGEFIAEIVALQFLAKLLGGTMWAYILKPRQNRNTNPSD